METRKISRIEHYANKLELNQWDRKDILEFYKLASMFDEELSKVNYLHTGTTDIKKRYDKVLYKVKRIGLYYTSIQLINQFLKAENNLFEKYQLMFPNLNNEEIWLKVYEEVDKEVDEEIVNAKEMRRQERKERIGCTNALLLFSFAAFIILFSLRTLFY